MRFLPVVFSVLVTGFLPGEEPAPSYAIERFSVIWGRGMFALPTDGKREAGAERNWILAGIILKNGERGAVIVNESTGAVEEVWRNRRSESGVKLIRVREGGVVEVEQFGFTFPVTRDGERWKTVRPGNTSFAGRAEADRSAR